MTEETLPASPKEDEGAKRITGAPFYPLYYISLAKTCKELGYALTVHGSMKRDLDLVAIPWTESAVDEKTLIETLIKNHDLMEGNSSQGFGKPHGRKSYVFIGFGGEETGYIDLAVMPLITESKANLEKAKELEARHAGLFKYAEGLKVDIEGLKAEAKEWVERWEKLKMRLKEEGCEWVQILMTELESKRT